MERAATLLHNRSKIRSEFHSFFPLSICHLTAKIGSLVLDNVHLSEMRSSKALSKHELDLLAKIVSLQ